MRPFEGVLLAPAAPGSLGDEGLMRGALAVLAGRRIRIQNPAPKPQWLNHLALQQDQEKELTESAGILSRARAPNHGQFLVVVGADMLDGTCGIAPALERLDYARRAIANGANVVINCSFRTEVAPTLVCRWKALQGAQIFLRDELSLENFQAQIGLACHLATDFSLHAGLFEDERALQARERLRAQATGREIIALNLSEQTFRSMNPIHDDESRQRFASELADLVLQQWPNAHFLCMSNDTRQWLNHPSDDFFSSRLRDRLLKAVVHDRISTVSGRDGYTVNANLLKEARLLITGRMHLALAAARVGCTPIIVMGESGTYSSINKMRGMMRYCGFPDNHVAVSLKHLDAKRLHDLAPNSNGRNRQEAFAQRTAIDCTNAKIKIHAAIDSIVKKPSAAMRALNFLRHECLLSKSQAKP